MKQWIFRISILLNLVFIIGYLFQTLNAPSGELGKLKKDVEIGLFMGDSVIMKIPKGLTVRNESERGLEAIGRFENERFGIIITSEDPNLMDYHLPKDSLLQFGHFYSADIKRWTE